MFCGTFTRGHGVAWRQTDGRVFNLSIRSSYGSERASAGSCLRRFGGVFWKLLVTPERSAHSASLSTDHPIPLE